MSIDQLTAALADRYAIERELGAGGVATVHLTEERTFTLLSDVSL